MASKNLLFEKQEVKVCKKTDSSTGNVYGAVYVNSLELKKLRQRLVLMRLYKKGKSVFEREIKIGTKKVRDNVYGAVYFNGKDLKSCIGQKFVMRLYKKKR